MKTILITVLILLVTNVVWAQHPRPATIVNVFLGTSGDHGQLSPGASSPFGMLDIAPQTYPNTHTGYEYKAKVFLGFTHDRLEGVGCMGSGGNLLIKPFLWHKENALIKKTEQASPGYYAVRFGNGIRTAIAAGQRTAVELYHFPKSRHGFYVDFSHTLANRFMAEKHQITTNDISGWIESGTTCNFGSYRLYYTLSFDQPIRLIDSTVHTVVIEARANEVAVRVGVSAISIANARQALSLESLIQLRRLSRTTWNKAFRHLSVKGGAPEVALFYSLLYRTLQAPTELTPGKYDGWTIWDNYRTALPLLSLIQPKRYQDVIRSIAALYAKGKQNWATVHELTNTVRTEHAIVVLLDAYRKGYHVGFKAIKDALIKEAEQLDFGSPDKALESCYDSWAFGQVFGILREDSLAKDYALQALTWKDYWNKDFKDLIKKDIDRYGARKMYQGTIWQYRWFVPFDQTGLIEACGGEKVYLQQLDAFFAGDYYNAANEPDIQAPYMYQFTSQPWRSQYIIRHYAQDTVIQYYSDDNYRGVGPQIGRVFNNRPNAFLTSMDDDMGAMSAWYIFAAIGLSPACVGYPVYYLHVPIFKSVSIGKFHITVKGRGRYIHTATLNGKLLQRNWLKHQEIINGGTLIINTSTKPNKDFGIYNQWKTSIKYQL